MPAGAFYAFPNVSGTGMPTRELADLLLNEAGVACLSGTAFGQLRRRISAIQLRQLAGEHPEALRRIGQVSERWAAVAK